jgi:hypothetical protein
MRRAAYDAAVALPTKASSTQATGQAKVTRGEASVQCKPVMALAAQLAEALHHYQQPAIPARYCQVPEVDTPMAATKMERPMEATQGPGPWAGVLLSDEEAIQIIAVLADVLDGHDVRDAVSAAWALLGNRLGAQAGVADPSPEDLASLHRRPADRPRPWANRRYPPPLPPN